MFQLSPERRRTDADVSQAVNGSARIDATTELLESATYTCDCSYLPLCFPASHRARARRNTGAASI